MDYKRRQSCCENKKQNIKINQRKEVKRESDNKFEYNLILIFIIIFSIFLFLKFQSQSLFYSSSHTSTLSSTRLNFINLICIIVLILIFLIYFSHSLTHSLTTAAAAAVSIALSFNERFHYSNFDRP
jgi:small-conductance mechanosensitive channel